jgi:hypothetical protein
MVWGVTLKCSASVSTSTLPLVLASPTISLWRGVSLCRARPPLSAACCKSGPRGEAGGNTPRPCIAEHPALNQSSDQRLMSSS